MNTIQMYVMIGLGVLLLGLSATVGVMKLSMDVKAAQIETLTAEKAVVTAERDTAVSVNQSNAKAYDAFRMEVARMSQIVLKNTLETQVQRQAIADIQTEIANVPDPSPTAYVCTLPATDRAYDWLRQQPRSLDPGAGAAVRKAD